MANGKGIVWDLGQWRDCFHFARKDYPEPHTSRKMSYQAIKYRRYDVKWGVVNPGNAICAQVFGTKREAEQYRKERARAYAVVKVIVTPIYTEGVTKEVLHGRKAKGQLGTYAQGTGRRDTLQN